MSVPLTVESTNSVFFKLSYFLHGSIFGLGKILMSVSKP